MHTLVSYYWIHHDQQTVSIYWLLENIHFSHNVQALEETNFTIQGIIKVHADNKEEENRAINKKEENKFC